LILKFLGLGSQRSDQPVEYKSADSTAGCENSDRRAPYEQEMISNKLINHWVR